MPAAAKVYMNGKSDIGLKRKVSFFMILQGFLVSALLLAGSVYLTGCSSDRKSGNSEAEWSFQAGNSPEEENPGNKEEGSDSSGAAGAESAEGGSSGAQEKRAAVSGSPDEAVPVNSVPSDETGTEVSGIQEPGYVYICGAVRRPGVYEIGEGTRVFEVIEQAGGFTKQADAEWLNQAEIVADGQKIQIYTKEETAAFKEAGLSAAGGTDQSMAAGAGGMPQGTDPQMTAGGGIAAQETAGDDKVNINTADKDLLMTLPGIGESKAEAILQYRQEHGNFGSIGDICQVSGIKEAVFSRIKDRITV